MIRAGIYGATGYAGRELLNILARHPGVEVAFAASETYAGQRYSDVYPCAHEHVLVAPNAVPLERTDVAFLCTPHHASAEIGKRVLDAGCKCVDLSADFRLRDVAVYEQWYGEHPVPELLPEAVYGLTEIYRERIAGARLVANPGCYPTGPLLALYPLLREGIVTDDRIIIDAKSGVSGAGATPNAKTHFCTVTENFSAYNVGHSHRHVPEMEQELRAYAGQAGSLARAEGRWPSAGRPVRVVFSPHLLPVTRGILSTIYISVDPAWTPERLLELWRDTYAGEPFIQVLDANRLATLAHAVHTNRCALSLAPAGGEGEVILVTALDNLIKGAAGQAVQDMNVMFGLDETAGLL